MEGGSAASRADTEVVTAAASAEMEVGSAASVAVGSRDSSQLVLWIASGTRREWSYFVPDGALVRVFSSNAEWPKRKLRTGVEFRISFSLALIGKIAGGLWCVFGPVNALSENLSKRSCLFYLIN